MEILNPTIKILNKLKIEYILCDPALYGLVNYNNINKYSNSYTLFIFKHQPIKMIILFGFLLIKKIILKIKVKSRSNGKQKFFLVMYKIVGKPTLLSKTSANIEIRFFKKEKNKLKVWMGGQFIFFDITDLNSKEIIKHNNMSISIPRQPKDFIQKYKNNIFVGLNKTYYIKLEDEKADEAKNLLNGVVDIFEHNQSQYFLDAGTLLGAVRDKGFIPWDHDIDLGLIYTNQEDVEKIVKELKKKFYVRSLKFKKDPAIWNPGKYRIIKVYKKSSLSIKDELCLDIFLFYKSILEENNQKVYKYGVWDRNAFYPENILRDFKSIRFYNRLYRVPKNPEHFLEFKYGKDWETPQKKWSTVLDDTSLTRNNLEKES